MSSTPGPKKPASGGVGRVANSETPGRSSPSLSRSSSTRSTTASTPSAGPGHARTRSTRTGTPVSARAALQRRDTGSMSNAESDARAEAAAAVEDLQQRLEKEERQSEQYRKQADVLQSKLEDSTKESAKMEEKTHELEELIEALRNEKREATRQIREMETIYEAEKSSILKEKEEMANREEEMQTVIQRLKDSLSQRNNNSAEDESRTSRQVHSSSPSSFDGNSFAPPSSLQRSDSRNNSKLILQKDKLIESLRLELAEAQIKLVESENQGGGRLQEVERSLMEARMANARLMEDNESYQLLLQEKTLKGDFGQNDFSYMGSNANQDALDALEGKGAGGDGGSVVGGSSLADELDEAADDTIVSTATEGAADTNGAGEADRRQETELRSLREQNKALTLYINKIIERLLQHQDFESILDQSGDMNPPTLPRPTSGTAPANTSKDLPPPPPPASDKPGAAASFLQRAKSIAGGPNGNTGSAGGYGTRTSSLGNQRPMSYMPSSSSGHTDPDTAPSIPIGNLTRTASKRQSRPRSEQFTGAASLVSQMYKGGAEGPASPTLGGHRHSQSFFAAPGGAGVAGGNPNAAAAARVPSGSSSQPPSSSGNFPGMRSETSSVSGESVGDLSTPPSQSPPRSHSDKGTTFAGGKPRPLRLVQENNPDATSKENKRSSWISGWGNWGKKDSNAGLEQETASIPE